MKFLKKLLLSETNFILIAANGRKLEAMDIGEPPSTFFIVVILIGHHFFFF